MRVLKLSVLALALLSTAASAQTEPPAALGSVKNLEAKGEVLGFEAWGAPGQDFLWLKHPETGAMIAGFPFDADGKSLNPAHQGDKALTLAGFIEANIEPYSPPVSVSEDGNVSVTLPDAQIPEVEALLGKLDEAGRKAEIAKLVEALRSVKSEADFNIAVAAWVEALRGLPGNAESAAPAAVTAPDAAASGDGAEAAPADAGKTLLQAMEGAFLLDAGKVEAPLAYAILDPSHAPSLAALKELKPKIETGELRLSILLVPASSEDAAGIVAGLLMSEDPVAALFALAETAEDPAAETPFRRFSDLPDAQEEGVRTNYALAVAYELPTLPFFGFHTAEGERYIKGIPSFEQFDGILAAPTVTPATEGAAVPVEVPVETGTEAPAE